MEEVFALARRGRDGRLLQPLGDSYVADMIASAGLENKALREQIDSDGGTHTAYQQYLNGIRIRGGVVTEHRGADGKIYLANGILLRPGPRLIASTLVARESSIAIQQAPEAGITRKEPPTLVVVDGRLARHEVLARVDPITWGELVFDRYSDLATGAVIDESNRVLRFAGPPYYFPFAAPYFGGSYSAPASVKGIWWPPFPDILQSVVVNGNLLTEEGGGLVSFPGVMRNRAQCTPDGMSGYTCTASGSASEYHLMNIGSNTLILDADGDSVRDGVPSSLTATFSSPPQVSAARALHQARTYMRYTNPGFRSVAHGSEPETVYMSKIRVGGEDARWNRDLKRIEIYWNYARPLLTLDVVGHEYGHGVSEELVAGGGFHYPDSKPVPDSGGLSESYADIFAMAVEVAGQPDGTGYYPNFRPGHFDWLMGEDAYGQALRDLTKAPAPGFPSPHAGWRGATCSHPKVAVTRDDSRLLSQIQSHAFYHLAQSMFGLACQPGQNACAIGAAARIALRALHEIGDPSADIHRSRTAWELAVMNLYRYDDRDLCRAARATIEAWNAVGIDSGNPYIDAALCDLCAADHWGGICIY